MDTFCILIVIWSIDIWDDVHILVRALNWFSVEPPTGRVAVPSLIYPPFPFNVIIRITTTQNSFIPNVYESHQFSPHTSCQLTREKAPLAPCPVRDWSLITGRGATKWESCGAETFCAPLPHSKERVKLFVCPPFKEWKLLVPPFNMAKTSGYRIKTTPKLVVPPPPPPSAWLKLLRPPFRRGKTSRAPPSHFVAPPPSPSN